MPHPDWELHKDPKWSGGVRRIERGAQPIIFGQMKGIGKTSGCNTLAKSWPCWQNALRAGIVGNSTIVVITEPPPRNPHQHHCLTTATIWSGCPLEAREYYRIGLDMAEVDAMEDNMVGKNKRAHGDKITRRRTGGIAITGFALVWNILLDGFWNLFDKEKGGWLHVNDEHAGWKSHWTCFLRGMEVAKSPHWTSLLRVFLQSSKISSDM